MLNPSVTNKGNMLGGKKLTTTTTKVMMQFDRKVIFILPIILVYIQ